MNFYDYTYKNVFEIAAVQDTDNVAGAEIIVAWPIGAYSIYVEKAVDIIHDRTVSINAYSYTSVDSFSIQAIRNYDSTPGAEVCVRWTKYPTAGYQLIIDRTRTIQNRSGC